MSALNLAIVVALGLALVGLACLLADRCRWPWMSIAEHERVLDDLTNQVLDSHAQGVEAGMSLNVTAKDLNLESDRRTKIMAGDSVKAAGYKFDLVKKNNVKLKLAVAGVIREIRRRGEPTSAIVHMLNELELLGCVAPDDDEALNWAGDRFAIEGEAVGDHPHVPELPRNPDRTRP